MSEPALVAFGPEDRERWNAFVADHQDGHFFQSWEWGELQVALGASPMRIAAVEGDRMVGAMQVLLFEAGRADAKGGVVRDRAFQFYYHENLEALAGAGTAP